VINTIVGAFYLRLAYVGLQFRQKQYVPLSEFDKLVKDWIYGDDNIYAISNRIIEWYNPQTLASYFKSYGIDYGTADKSGAEQSIREIRSLRFLKRYWRPDEEFPNAIWDPIDLDTVYEWTNWIRQCDNEDEQLHVQIDVALREAVAHGKEFYLTFRDEVNSALTSVGLRGHPDEYELIRENWLRNVLSWGTISDTEGRVLVFVDDMQQGMNRLILPPTMKKGDCDAASLKHT